MNRRFRFDARMAPEGVGTLVELLEDRGLRRGEDAFMAFLGGARLSFGALRAGALRVAGLLQARGLRRGDRCVLLFPTCPELIESLFGVLYAGGVPVPMYPPPMLGTLGGYLERQRRLANNADARLLICATALERVGLQLTERVREHPAVIPWADVQAADGLEPVLPCLEDTDTALIQYTSGSTGQPKGVMLSHSAILSNCHALGEPVRFRPDDWMNNWLPLYHDMGLIGMVMFPLCYGVRTHMMGPQDFLEDPLRWLRSISDGMGTVTVAPNFAYGYLLRKLEGVSLPPDLDLSAWRICYHGAEPISAELLDNFTARLAPHGFRREVFSPVYGMAENSLIATCPDHSAGPHIHRIDRGIFDREGRAVPAAEDDPNPRRQVGVGWPVQGTELRVVDAQGRQLPEGHEGRIILRGSSMSSGYFRNPVVTAAAFVDGWLQTGDLGYLADGQLFVTGRSKDLIILQGSKYHPQDLEEAAGEVPGVRAGCSVAFGIHDPDQADALVVVVVESRADTPEARQAIAKAVTRKVAMHTACRPDFVAVLPPKTVPKTSSGKLQRATCREHFVARALELPVDEVRYAKQHLGALRERLGLKRRA
jgi:fatty-acyl-CoA synthase